MRRNEWPPRLAIVLGYAVLALAFAWPLPLALDTRLTGDPGGDTGVYVWNQWVFHHEVTSGHQPLATDRVFAMSGPVDLSQHNYTVFLDLLALPLIPVVGVVAAFNLVMLAVMALTALCGYALARAASPATRLEAFAAGLAFAWSPALVARTTGHASLVAAAPLAAFAWCLLRGDQTRHPGFAALAGLVMAWAGYCDPYFAVFCLMMAAAYGAGVVTRVSWRPQASGGVMVRALHVLILVAAAVVAGVAIGGGGRLEVAGLAVSVRGLYTPVLVLTVLLLLRAALPLRLSVDLRPHARWLLTSAAVLAATCGVALAPVILGLARRVLDGRFVSPPILWRSSPRGVDLLAYFHPNPNHPVSRWLIGDGQSAAPVVFVEYTAALSLVALAVITLAAWRARYRPHPAWWWMLIGSATLALGPFVIVAGVNSHVPGPWALLRYVPVISAVRTPTRFAIVAALGAAVLLAGALAAIGARWPHRRRAIATATLLALILELMPAPRPLFDGTYAATSAIVAADPRPVRVLTLPFGIRDGASSAGNFNARSLFEQTRHGKALLGGYLSRVSDRRRQAMVEAFPELATLLDLSEGRPTSSEAVQRLIQSGPAFVDRAGIGHVVVDTRTAPTALVGVAIEAFRLELVAADGVFELYRPGP